MNTTIKINDRIFKINERLANGDYTLMCKYNLDDNINCKARASSKVKIVDGVLRPDQSEGGIKFKCSHNELCDARHTAEKEENQNKRKLNGENGKSLKKTKIELTSNQLDVNQLDYSSSSSLQTVPIINDNRIPTNNLTSLTREANDIKEFYEDKIKQLESQNQQLIIKNKYLDAELIFWFGKIKN